MTRAVAKSSLSELRGLHAIPWTPLRVQRSACASLVRLYGTLTIRCEISLSRGLRWLATMLDESDETCYSVLAGLNSSRWMKGPEPGRKW